MAADEVDMRNAFDGADEEAQRAVMVALDVTHASIAFGPTAPQTLLARDRGRDPRCCVP